MKFIRQHHRDTAAGDHALLADYRKSGDLQVLATLYERYMTLVYGLCLKYLRDEERSKDAVMEIFEQLVKKLLVHEVSNFKSWLFTLSRNYCLMEIRAGERHPQQPIDESVENSLFLHLTDDRRDDELRKMESCLKKLPAEQETAVRLFYLEELCYKEVSERSGFDLNKVKSYIQNGKRNLKICMEKHHGK